MCSFLPARGMKITRSLGIKKCILANAKSSQTFFSSIDLVPFRFLMEPQRHEEQGDMKLSLEQIVQATGGQILESAGGTAQHITFDSFGIDSRKIKSGGLFFALQGESTDGHLFIEDAFKNGAAGAVVSKKIDGAHSGVFILVEDTLNALQKLGGFVRNNSASQFVGITGSAGKTS